MRKTKAFTLIELLVVISIIALLIGILLPALGMARRTARQMKGTTQVRSIYQGFVIFSSGNNQRFPGLTRDGQVLTFAETATTGGQLDGGYSPANRLAIALKGGFFTPEIMISPSESKTEATLPTVNTDNYSYSLRNINKSEHPDYWYDYETPQPAGVDAALQALVRNTVKPWNTRAADWRADEISTKAIISDRPIDNSSAKDGSAITSVHVSTDVNRTDWRGSVGYNDGHADFETSATEDIALSAGGDNYTTTVGLFIAPTMVYGSSLDAFDNPAVQRE